MMTENEYQHEIVKPDNGLPARYFLSNDGRPAMAPMHYHDAIEIMYCTRGCVTLTKGSEAILLQEGDVVVVNINEMHMTTCKNSYTTAFIIQILAPFLQSVSGMSETYFRIPVISGGNIPRGIIEKIRELEEAIEDFFELTKGIPEDPYLFMKAQGSLCGILYLLFLNFQDTHVKVPQRNHKNFERVRKIREYIDRNYDKGISLDDIAAHTGLAPAYFSRFFSETFGMGFLQYLYQIRMKHAYVDVITTNTPLISIAMDNGFSSYSLFNSKFKETYDLTPAQARRRYSGEQK